MALGLTTMQGVSTALLFGLATSAFPYAGAFVAHQPVAGLLFAAFLVLWSVRRQALGTRWFGAAGFLLGYAVIAEYPAVLAGGVIGLYGLFAVGWRRALVGLGWLIAGAVPPLVVLAAYDYAAFGTVLPIGYFHSVLWEDVHHTGFLSLTYPRLEALWGLTFGLDRGLFFLSPYLVFAAAGYAVLWRRRAIRPELAVLLLVPLAFLLFNASSAMWQGGFGVGPRYLVPALPFLALAAGVGVVSAWRRPAARPVVILAAGWSGLAVWAETIGGQAYPDYTANPLFNYSLPRLLEGDIARNAGMALGLSGWWSLAPLGLVLLVAGAALWGPTRPAPTPAPDAPAWPAGGRPEWAGP
jgi:hypothetical protein